MRAKTILAIPEGAICVRCATAPATQTAPAANGSRDAICAPCAIYIYPMYEVWINEPAPPIGSGQPTIYGETVSLARANATARELKASGFPGVEVRRIPNQVACKDFKGDLDIHIERRLREVAK